VFFITLSGALLWLAQRHIPIGTAHAIWTGIGAVGTFAAEVLIYDGPTSLLRYVAVALIIAGAATLKLAH
jgi:quaternary ammonium compound-resistance protein SugE